MDIQYDVYYMLLIILVFQSLSGHTGNLVASPLSAQLVLALAQLGARGDTASEMATALCLPADAETSKNGFLALMNTLKVIVIPQHISALSTEQEHCCT